MICELILFEDSEFNLEIDCTSIETFQNDFKIKEHARKIFEFNLENPYTVSYIFEEGAYFLARCGYITYKKTKKDIENELKIEFFKELESLDYIEKEEIEKLKLELYL